MPKRINNNDNTDNAKNNDNKNSVRDNDCKNKKHVDEKSTEQSSK